MLAPPDPDPAARRSSWRRWALVAGVVAIALIAGIELARYGYRAADEARAAAALLAVELPDPSGRVQRIDQWRGKVLVVNFWATWCVPCREEMPGFIKAQAASGGRGLQFVGIAVDKPEPVQRFASELGLNYPTLIGGLPAMVLSRELGNRLVALPFTIVLDRGGRVVATHLGPVKPADLHAIVDPLLQP